MTGDPNIPDSAIADYERIQAMPEPSVPFCFYSQTGHDWYFGRCKCGATRCKKAECVEESCGGEFGMCAPHEAAEWAELAREALNDYANEETSEDRRKTFAVVLENTAHMFGCADKALRQQRRFTVQEFAWIKERKTS